MTYALSDGRVAAAGAREFVNPAAREQSAAHIGRMLQLIVSAREYQMA